ncbi:TPA: hypothetical protein ACW0I5_004754 [Escherichia coli]
MAPSPSEPGNTLRTFALEDFLKQTRRKKIRTSGGKQKSDVSGVWQENIAPSALVKGEGMTGRQNSR